MYWIFLSAGRYRRALGWLAPSLLLASVQAFGAEGLTFNQALQLALRQSLELRGGIGPRRGRSAGRRACRCFA